MKVSELKDKQLDYWVAKAEGHQPCEEWDQDEYILVSCGDGEMREYSPSTDWEDGGPIIEREGIELWPDNATDEKDPVPGVWFASLRGIKAQGARPLVAAVRAYITSIFGEEVPDEPRDAS